MNDKIIHKIKGYLGYDVLCENYYLTERVDFGMLGKSEQKREKGYVLLDSCIFDIGGCGGEKLILRPLEDLTDEELDNIVKIEGFPSLNMRENTIKYINHYLMEEILTMGTIEYFHKNHIDYQDLIGQGLAIKKELK
jgi:hypothetical protein